MAKFKYVSNFRKLWGTINVNSAGYYDLEVESVSDFEGSEKSLYFTEKSWLGLKNYGLTFGLIGLGLALYISALCLRKAAIRSNLY